MNCSFCGLEFDGKEEGKKCSGCSSFSQCGKIKCPRCGYNAVPEPRWAGAIRDLFRKEKRNEHL
ncbi:MAG: hypothetical protein ABIG55_02420 [Candidatus Omnitrophota bacterium]|nr:hypothetical protein [Candidatus Omnitrophota bacterium]